jgi:hypothetical protein
MKGLYNEVLWSDVQMIMIMINNNSNNNNNNNNNLLIFIKHLFNKLSSVAVILLTEGILRLLA